MVVIISIVKINTEATKLLVLTDEEDVKSMTKEFIPHWGSVNKYLLLIIFLIYSTTDGQLLAFYCFRHTSFHQVMACAVRPGLIPMIQYVHVFSEL